MNKALDAWIRVSRLLLLLFIPLVLLTLTRNLFWIQNQKSFSGLGFGDWLIINLHGLRFDISAIAAFNAVFIVLYLMPIPWLRQKAGKRLLSLLFVVVNGLLLLANFVDSAYFGFTLKRTTADIFVYLGTGEDMLRLIPRYVFLDYWYLTLLWLLFVYVLYRLVNLVEQTRSSRCGSSNISWGLISVVLFSGLIVLSVRGGFQLKPLRPIQAAEVMGPQYSALVLNTPFSIMKSYGKKPLQERVYYDESTLDPKLSPIKKYSRGTAFRPFNVVIIIMESFSKEYMGEPYGKEGLTPFLDSLAAKGLFFNAAFANGKKSIEAIPAIISSLPTLMDEPYITSTYSANSISALPRILKKKGYTSAFFHGGATGTMGFDAYCKLAGFDSYFGLEDYPYPNGFDGGWGIYDGPFFRFFFETLEQTEQPFLATFFSLSSHHPYKLPQEHNTRFAEGKHPLFKTIRYADWALQQFFESASGTDWFENTLFIITADHTSLAFHPYYTSRPGNYAIPLLFYRPGDTALSGISSRITQQIDIMPTVLDYLHYSDSFFSFGASVMDESREGFSISYLNDLYQFLGKERVVFFDGKKSSAMYRLFGDSVQRRNLISEEHQTLAMLERRCKTIIQFYNSALITNQLVIPE